MEFVKKYKISILGILIGGILGYAYYHFIGCSSGTCAITAQIIDVRTPAEYNGGHIKGSKNIPLQSLNQNLGKINKNKPVITCCASGARSAAAKSILLNSGFSEVYNGGGWSGLKSKLS